MSISRRNFLKGAGATFLCAPPLVSCTNIMKVVPIRPRYELALLGLPHGWDLAGESKTMWSTWALVDNVKSGPVDDKSLLLLDVNDKEFPRNGDPHRTRLPVCQKTVEAMQNPMNTVVIRSSSPSKKPMGRVVRGSTISSKKPMSRFAV